MYVYYATLSYKIFRYFTTLVSATYPPMYTLKHFVNAYISL